MSLPVMHDSGDFNLAELFPRFFAQLMQINLQAFPLFWGRHGMLRDDVSKRENEIAFLLLFCGNDWL